MPAMLPRAGAPPACRCRLLVPTACRSVPAMDPYALVAAERLRLADELGMLSAEEWAQPSLCGEWTNAEVLAHLNVPFVLSTPAFLVGLAKARGSFDRANARFATELAERMDPAACVASLRANAEHRFHPPGF